MKNKKCICIGAGEFYETNIPRQEGDLLIAVDGGYTHCRNLGLKVDVMVSDFDSYSGEKIEDAEVLESNPIKDDTDMLLALQEGLKRGYREFVIYGGLGGRIEHSFANIQCLKYLCEHNAHGTLISKSCVIDVLNQGIYEFDETETGYISVFSLSDTSCISIENLKYTLDHAKLNSSYPIGIDNEFIQKKGQITIHEGCICIIKNKE